MIENYSLLAIFTWKEFWPLAVAIGIVLTVIPALGLYMTFVERKVAAWIQDRVGPNRVGPAGLLQAVADAIKIFLKEQVIPNHVFRSVYFVAPIIGLMCAMVGVAVVPFGPVEPDNTGGFRAIIAPNVDIGLLFLLAVSSLSAYGIVLGGWASNNKYSMFGALRSCAQFISYEIPLGVSLLGVITISGTFNLERIVAAQGAGIMGWNFWWQPLAALLFFTAALAETNRLPFDLPECEQELVGGFHTEYGGIKFSLFFLAEYTHLTIVSFLTVLLFFGGWNFVGLSGPVDGSLLGFLLRWLILVLKVALVTALVIQLRWTLPRFRFDQLMSLAWSGMIPLAILNYVGVVTVLTFDLPTWLLGFYSIALFLVGGWWTVNSLAINRGRSVRTVAAAR